MVFSLSALWWRRLRDLWKLPDGRDWLREKLGLVLMGRIMLSKSFNPIFCWWLGLCSLPVIFLRPNYGWGNEDNGDLPQNVPCRHCYTQFPQPCSKPPLTHTSAGDSWTLTGKSGENIWILTSLSIQWTWVCINPGSWWWTGRPGLLQSTGWQRVIRDWATELKWTEHHSRNS